MALRLMKAGVVQLVLAVRLQGSWVGQGRSTADSTRLSRDKDASRIGGDSFRSARQIYLPRYSQMTTFFSFE